MVTNLKYTKVDFCEPTLFKKRLVP